MIGGEIVGRIRNPDSFITKVSTKIEEYTEELDGSDLERLAWDILEVVEGLTP